MLNKVLALLLCLFSLACAAEQTALEVIPLFNRPAVELQPLIAPLLNETDQIVAKDFNLIVKTTPARLHEIKELIKKLDTAPTNLAIRVIQSKDKTAEELNAAAHVNLILPINQGDVTGHVGGYVQQQQYRTNNNSEQVLKTLEGRPAYIKTGINAPIHFNTLYGGYGQPPVIASNTQYIEATTGFAVLPRLHGNEVILEISPWSDQMKNNGLVETQTAQTTITAKLGQWVEIGSINEQAQTDNRGLMNMGHGISQNTIRILVQVEKVP